MPVAQFGKEGMQASDMECGTQQGVEGRRPSSSRPCHDGSSYEPMLLLLVDGWRMLWVVSQCAVVVEKQWPPVP